ncbi:hypothetical protein CC86DRAFT_466148 [Ophiobolus disseminans]|uniref:Uncharacterized protein n=1 Tax=Ophiobolus disseminans TaxID=1469910 RepID=A0A6A7A267_9PLEO|nr:hypothetical protein CC86DRAFT_466148 [Ophiobolus disseminans]
MANPTSKSPTSDTNRTSLEHTRVILSRLNVEQAAAMLRLSDELLLMVTDAIDGDQATSDLRQLALAHSRFRPIVHETLMRNCVIPIRSIPMYLILISRHPAWIRHINKITLIAKEPAKNELKVSHRALEASRSFIRSLWPSVLLQKEQEFQLGMESSELWALVLFAALSNVKEVLLRPMRGQWPAAYESLLVRTAPRDTFKLQQCLFDVVKDRLEVLSIDNDGPLKPAESLSLVQLRLYTMSELKILNLAVRIGYPFDNRGTQWALPPNLEVLRIHCDQATFPWHILHGLHYAMTQRNAFSSLRQVQLLLGLPCRSLARYLVCGMESEVDILSGNVLTDSELLADWKTLKKSSLETYFPKHGELEHDTLDLTQYRPSCLLEEIRCVEEELGRSINFSV